MYVNLFRGTNKIMDNYKILYEYTYTCESGYTFKKQICIDDSKRTFFNFIVNNHFHEDLLLTSFDNDFKDKTLKIKIKEYLLKEIKDLVNVKTLFLTIRNQGKKANVEVLKSGIKFEDKIFKLKNNDYHDLQYRLLDYIKDLKDNVK